MNKNVTGIILAGGKNSRMGVNKAFLEIDGVRLIEKTLNIYRQIFNEIIIVTNDPLAYIEFADASVVTDIYKGKGPLGGIYTGLFYAKNPYAFISACDMPFLNKDFILYMIDQKGRYDIVVPEHPEGFQTLHALYSGRCLLYIKRMIEAENLKISDLYKEVRTLGITEEKIKPFEKDKHLFLNLNTPEDLKAHRR
ncbi:MAG TPA: molybdenum cofactor guanylyltransferase [Smithella sp.]|nr:molybdenum cofactor guanylyltransferase [Smithella sp.]